jgi:lipopolysaccharide/colanic/teichoic acid biosynthesis glycosyltransferase
LIERIIALILFVLLLPVFGIIFFLIFVFDGNPIFYSHKRYGLAFKVINLHKFRTMKIGEGSPITFHNDDRITSLGKIVRMFKLDELPQLINIIAGEMSFVGPRPESIKIVNENRQYFSYLNHLTPGITDINSIIFKDEARLFNITNEKMYLKEILPLKSAITERYGSDNSIIKVSMILMLTLLSFVHHNLSLRIISRYFLPSVDGEIRNKLNDLFIKQIF